TGVQTCALPIWSAEGIDPAAAAERLLGEHARAPFDPALPPLARAVLIRQAPRLHVLQLVVHHLVSDGWSMGLLTREIGERYRIAASGGRHVGPAPALEFVDHARWRAGVDTGHEGDAALARWCERLAGVSDLQLPPACVP